LGREIAGQDQQRGHRENSLEDPHDILDGYIAPNDLVNGKRLERTGPGDNDERQEDSDLLEEIVRDSTFKANDIGRQHRKKKDNKVDQTLADFTENEVNN
jgi:hypothetical protein